MHDPIVSLEFNGLPVTIFVIFKPKPIHNRKPNLIGVFKISQTALTRSLSNFQRGRDKYATKEAPGIDRPLGSVLNMGSQFKLKASQKTWAMSKQNILVFN